MKTLATVNKQSKKTSGKVASNTHSSMSLSSKAQRNSIHEIIQPKLTIGQANDRYEREADSVADHVVADKPAPKISSISGPLASNSQSVQSKPEAEEQKAQAKFVQRQAEEEEEPAQTKFIQRQAEEEEEPAQAKFIQRQAEEEEEPVQAKFIQRQAEEEEEPAQAKFIQRQAEEEEEPAQAKFIQRQAEEEEESIQTNLIQRKESYGDEKEFVDSTSTAENSIKNSSGGSPIRTEIKNKIESGIGTDLSHVRVHEDSSSHRANTAIKAKAFTHKNNIYLGSGQSQSDLHLMAHESTHIVQQGAASQTGMSSSADTGVVQKLENSENEGGAVGPIERARAMAAALVAKQQADAKALKSRQQREQEKQKKAKEEKKKLTEEEKKKNAEQKIEGDGNKNGDEEGGEKKSLTKKIKSVVKKGLRRLTKGKAKKEGDKAPASPEEDPAFQMVVGKSKKQATSQKKHKPAKDEADAAQNAAEPPANEVDSKAQGNQVDTMESAETPGFDAVAFKAKLMERIEAMAPKTAKEADDFKDSGKVNDLKEGMSGEVESEKESTQTPMQEASNATPDSSAIEPKPVTPLEEKKAGPEPGNVNPEKATIKQKGNSEVEAPIKEKTNEIGSEMDEAGVTEDQLIKSNEPSFNEALSGKKEAEAQSESAPKEYRQYESGTVETSQQGARETATAALGDMAQSRNTAANQVSANQDQTKSGDTSKRAEIATNIGAIYDQTKVEVETILTKLDEDVAHAFDTGAAAATQVFEGYVDAKMTAYKEERYGGWLGWAKWAKDKIAGMPSAVNRFYSEGRNRYLKEMDAVINNVVAIIGKGLTSAKAKVAEGKQKISEYVADLPDELKKLGEQAANDIQDKFDSLESDIDAKQDQLINDLAQKYNDSLKAVDARIEELKAANKGLVDKVVGFVKGVIETIKKLKEMLSNLLSKIAGVIGDIIADPIGFLGNLIKGIKMGFDKFVGNIMKHLISGLVKWLTGALGPMGITIPEDIFSLKGIFSLVAQVLGLTWDYFRRKAVKLLGEPVVKALEVGFEVFKIVKEKGVAGLWEYIKEQFSNLKEMVIEQIKSMIITQVITAGVKWIIGLLNPVGAFIKAAMAIYEIVKFFIERAAQIYEFVNSVVDSIADIVKGNLSGAAQKVETALANSIPLIIGFLASLLGISGLAKKVQGVIQKVRKKIDKAIDKIILKAKKFFKSAKKGAGKIKDKAISALFWWKKEKKLQTADGKSHTIKFKGKDKSAKLMISTTPMEYTDYIRDLISTQGLDSKDSKVKKAISIADEIDKKKKKTVTSNKEEQKTKEIVGLVDNLVAATKDLPLKSEGENNTSPVYGPLRSGWGTYARVKYMQAKHPIGSSPSVGNDTNFEYINIRRKDNGSLYVKGHLLNDNLGGPGSTWKNLTPITGAANTDHKNNFEKIPKIAVNGTDARISQSPKKPVGAMQNFSCVATYGRSLPSSYAILSNLDSDEYPDGWNDNWDRSTVLNILKAEQYVPQSIQCSVGYKNKISDPWKNHSYTVKNEINYGNLKQYQLVAKPKTTYVFASKILWDKPTIDEKISEISKLSLIGKQRAKKIYYRFESSGQIHSFKSVTGITLKALESHNPGYKFKLGTKP